MRTTIIKLDDIPEDLERLLAENFCVSDIRLASREKLEGNILAAKVAVANGESRLTAENLSCLPQLKLVSVFGVGYDGIDLDYTTEHGITVTNTPGVLTEDVADLAIAFAMSLVREIIPANSFVRNGLWQHQRYPLTRKFSNRKIGIVGMGRIGQEINQRLSGFGCKIYYYSKNDLHIDAHYFSDLKKMADAVDILIVSASSRPENNELINLDVLNLLGPEGYLINVSRGSIVNQDDLVIALEEKRIAGAALDVLKNEPLVPEGLIRPNVILTPHFASGTVETREAMSRLVVQNIEAFLTKGLFISPVTL